MSILTQLFPVKRPLTLIQFWRWMLLLLLIIASVQYLQYYIFYNSSYPFPYLTNLVNSYGTALIFGLLAFPVLRIYPRVFGASADLWVKISLHLVLALLLACTHLLIMHFLGWLQVYQWAEASFFSTYRFLLSKWLHIEVLIYMMLYFSWRGLVYVSEKPDPRDEFLTSLKIKEGGQVKFVSTKDIKWLEAYDNYVKVWVNGQFHLVRTPLKDLEQQLDPGQFLRTHRSIIVALEHLEATAQNKGQYEVVLKDGIKLKLSRNLKSEIEKALANKARQ